jgi:hypothetical protein
MSGRGVAPLDRLAAMVCKQGVAMGGLSDDERRLALALVWRGLDAVPVSERDINEALKRQLAGAASFLGSDHVELRRWLVDGGWLQRDGFGREYRRVEPAALPDAARPIAVALAGIDPEPWAAACRNARGAERARRREAWLASHHRA